DMIRDVARLLTNSGTPAAGGRSSPLKLTSTAPALMPAAAIRSRNRTPVHSALPMAPLAHCPPNTRGAKYPRPLPEHWLTATMLAGVNFDCSSSRESSRGLSTWPAIFKRQVDTSTETGGEM